MRKEAPASTQLALMDILQGLYILMSLTCSSQMPRPASVTMLTQAAAQQYLQIEWRSAAQTQ